MAVTVWAHCCEGTAAERAALTLTTAEAGTVFTESDTTRKDARTTAGDVSYYGTVDTRIAIGTAYQHLRVNSGATAPEWATETKSKSITIPDPADGDIWAMYMNEAAKEILGVSFASVGGTSVLFSLDYAATIASGTVIHTDTCATSTPEWDVTPSGTTSVPTDQIIVAEITTVTDAVTQLHITFHYRDNA
jgi:hypothetical protein